MLEVSQKSKQETRRVQPSFQLHIVTGGVETRENWPPYSAFSVYYHDKSVCKGYIWQQLDTQLSAGHIS